MIRFGRMRVIPDGPSLKRPWRSMESSDLKAINPAPSAESPWKSLEKAPALLAAGSTSLYVLGFLVVTGYLGSKGIHDHPFLSPRYVMAGALTAACALMYYFFVWRKMARRARDGMRVRPDTSAAFRAYLTHYFVVEDLFNCAFFSIWLVGIFGTSAYSQIFGIAVAAVYLVDQGIFAWCGPRYPRLSFIMSGLLLAVSTSAFVAISGFYSPLLAAFGVTLTFTLVGMAVLTSKDWSQNQDRLYGFCYLAFTAAVAAIAFGTTVYGQLSPRFGGGQPPLVKVIFSKEADANIRTLVETTATEAFLLADDKDTLTLELRGPANAQRILRLDRNLVQAIQFERVVQKEIIAEWISAHILAGSASSFTSPASSNSQRPP